MTFRLFDQSSGGTPLWTSAKKLVAPQAGHFSVILGNELPLTNLWDSPPARFFLELTVDKGPPMTGRQEIFPNAMTVMGVPQAPFRAGSLHVQKNDADIDGRLVVGRGFAPLSEIPNGWGGGLHTFDVYAEGTVGAGANGNLAAYMNRDGHFQGVSLTVSGALNGGSVSTQGDLSAPSNRHGTCQWLGRVSVANNDGTHWNSIFECPDGHFFAGVDERQRASGDWWGHVARIKCCEL